MPKRVRSRRFTGVQSRKRARLSDNASQPKRTEEVVEQPKVTSFTVAFDSKGFSKCSEIKATAEEESYEKDPAGSQGQTSAKETEGERAFVDRSDIAGACEPCHGHL